MRCSTSRCGKLPGPPALLGFPPERGELMGQYIARLTRLSRTGVPGASDAVVELFNSATWQWYSRVTRTISAVK